MKLVSKWFTDTDSLLELETPEARYLVRILSDRKSINWVWTGANQSLSKGEMLGIIRRNPLSDKSVRLCKENLLIPSLDQPLCSILNFLEEEGFLLKQDHDSSNKEEGDFIFYETKTKVEELEERLLKVEQQLQPPKESIDWKKMAEVLWQLLDHIDTADDYAKESDKEYRCIVREYAAQRFNYLTSDGYTLWPSPK